MSLVEVEQFPGVFLIKQIENGRNFALLYAALIIFNVVDQVADIGIRLLIGRNDQRKLFFALDTATFSRCGSSVNS